MAEVEVKYTIPAQTTDVTGYQADIVFTYDPASMGADGSVIVSNASGTVSEIDQSGKVVVNNGVTETDTITGVGVPKENYSPSGTLDNKLFINPTASQTYVDGHGIVYEVAGPWSDSNSDRNGPNTGDNVVLYGTVNDAGINRTGYYEYGNQSALDATSFTVTPVCFVTGTLIETARGDVAVQDLRRGDVAMTSEGALKTIKWIGCREIRCADENMPWETWPVRVGAGAFGNETPRRDLFLSPGHPVLVTSGSTEVLVPIMCLINGTTIERTAGETVTYWHIELEEHDILLAEGLPAESFFDFGNRAWFSEGERQALANPDFIVPEANGRCRPVVVDGPIVDAERMRLDRLFEARLRQHCDWPSVDVHAC